MTYEPADVARAITTEARGYRIDEAIIAVALQKMGVLLVDPASVVILDPNKPDDADRLSDVLNNLGGDGGMFDRSWAVEVIKRLLPTPPLPEPNGLGAVVKWDGDDFVRAEKVPGLAPWLRVVENRDGSLGWRFWSAMPGAVIKGHGVGCSCGGPGCPGGDA